MDTSIKQVFDDVCGGLVLNQKFLARLDRYVTGFVNRNSDHITFFGGNLTGVQSVKFREEDRRRWFDDVIDADEGVLQDRLHALPSINKEFKVSSDVMNNSCLWLAHALYHSKHLSPAQRHAGMHNAIMVMQIKFLTSRMARHFRWPADKRVAEATYNELSNKFALKQHGSWKSLLDARAEKIITQTHIRTINNFEPDREIIESLNDIQGGIRSLLKHIFAVFLTVVKQGIRVNTTSSLVEHDGVEVLKDHTKTLAAYTNYINSQITDRNSFIKEELVAVIEKMMMTMPSRLFRDTLGWMSDNYRQRGSGVIEQVVNETLVHAFQYMSNNRDVVRQKGDLPALLSRIRGVYMSSRSTDPVLLSLRDQTERMVQLATHNKNSSVLAAVRTGVLLYIVIRTITMKYYS